MQDKLKESFQSRILLALLDFEMRSRLDTVLSGAGYDVVNCAQNGDLPILAAVDELRSYDLAIWDVEMLDQTAARQIEDLQTRSEFPPLILVTAFSDPHALQRVGRLKTEATFDTPLNSYHQLATVLRTVPL